MGFDKQQSKTVNNVKDAMAANKLFFHKPGSPKFVDKTTGHECMLLFTDPLNQQSSEGEMAILGMPFFREYEISFDFCTKEIFTKRSYGDCVNKVGKHPHNVQWCTDKDWFGCWLEGFTNFVTSSWEGFLHMFLPEPSSNVDLSETVEQLESAKRAGWNSKRVAKIKPEALRLSSAAQWLLQSTG